MPFQRTLPVGTISPGLSDLRLLVQPENRKQGIVDALLLLRCEVASEVSESAEVNSADLFDQHPGEVPSTSMSGRNDAGLALVDVGATSTTERGRNASDCTTTPYRLPFCDPYRSG